MIDFTITKAQAQDFASACFSVIISEIKDTCNTEETESLTIQVEEHQNAA